MVRWNFSEAVSWGVGEGLTERAVQNKMRTIDSLAPNIQTTALIRRLLQKIGKNHPSQYAETL